MNNYPYRSPRYERYGQSVHFPTFPNDVTGHPWQYGSYGSSRFAGAPPSFFAPSSNLDVFRNITAKSVFQDCGCEEGHERGEQQIPNGELGAMTTSTSADTDDGSISSTDATGEFGPQNSSGLTPPEKFAPMRSSTPLGKLAVSPNVPVFDAIGHQSVFQTVPSTDKDRDFSQRPISRMLAGRGAFHELATRHISGKVTSKTPFRDWESDNGFGSSQSLNSSPDMLNSQMSCLTLDKHRDSYNGCGRCRSFPCRCWTAPKPTPPVAGRFVRSGAQNFPTWYGTLPARNSDGAFSCKVFLGGTPWDLSDKDLFNAFWQFGEFQIERPNKSFYDPNNPHAKGYCYIIFNRESSVRMLLNNCTPDTNQQNGEISYFFKVSSQRMHRKDIQVIPWALSDANWVSHNSVSMTGTYTVFVGSLHGMLTASGVSYLMNEFFGPYVVSVTIDTDKYKYPIGSGRVVFSNQAAYYHAVKTAFIEVRTFKISKKIQIEPFLEHTLCDICHADDGPYFCKEPDCFVYYCKDCWGVQHQGQYRANHMALVRQPRIRNDPEF